VTDTTDGGVVRLPGEGNTTSLFGDTYVVKAAGHETGGALAVIEAGLAPHSGGTPLHINTLEDENYYVVEGSLTFRLGERTLEHPRAPSSTFPKASYIPIGTPPARQSGYWASPLRPASRCTSPISPS
jgi:hypothetical protein